jgi:hypothetical protein
MDEKNAVGVYTLSQLKIQSPILILWFYPRKLSIKSSKSGNPTTIDT